MIKTSISMLVDIRELDRIMREYPREAKKIVDKAATNVQASAIRNTHTYGGSSRDTSAMINGWVTILTSGAGGNIPPPRSELEATVGNEVAIYPVLWELGHRGFAPEPSLGDAVESERKPFEKAWKGLLK